MGVKTLLVEPGSPWENGYIEPFDGRPRDELLTGEFHEMVTGGAGLTVVDVRAPGEYDGFHIDGAMNIPVPDLRTRHAELDPNRPVVVVCASGHRSSLASSILRRQGFDDVRNAAGGMTAYAAAGYGPECPTCAGPHGPGAV